MDGPWAIMLCAVIISPFGIALNGLVVYIWHGISKQNTATGTVNTNKSGLSIHVYFMALAVCDILAIVFDGLIDGLQAVFATGDFDVIWLCTVDTVLDFVTTYATYWVLVLVTVERVLFTEYQRTWTNSPWNSKKTGRVVLACMLGFLLLCGVVFFVILLRSDKGNCKCENSESELSTQLIVSTAFGAILPIVLVLGSSGYILFKIKVPSAAPRESRLETDLTRARNQEIRRSVIMIAVIFVVLCGTAQILTFVAHFNNPENHELDFSCTKKGENVVARTKSVVYKEYSNSLDELLNVVNSSLNFFIFFYTSSMFRENANKLFDAFRAKYFKKAAGPDDNKQLSQEDIPQETEI